MLVIKITETGRRSLKDEPQIFNHETIYAKDKQEVIEKLTERYGKLPRGKNKVYVDTKNGKTQEIGFLHSFWNKDWSHNSKPWYQTDWVTVVKRNEQPINVL